MTVNDENSVYVGGLPYNFTEDDLRQAFDLYGGVIEAKVINDRDIVGKCYGFVTFANPRSAVDAINDMNGRKIGGRVVRVNEVHSRGGRPNFHHENYRRDTLRNWERGRDRERVNIRNRDSYRDRTNERPRDRDRERERDFEHGHDFDRARERTLDRGRDQEDRDQEHAREINQDYDRLHDMEWDHDGDTDKTKDHDGSREVDKEQQSRQRTGARYRDRRSRESSSNSSDDCDDEVREQLEKAMQRHEELQKEVTLVEVKIKEKQLHNSELLKQSQKLEEALAAARKLTSQRQSRLTKLYRYYRQAQELAEGLKSSEQELQSLVDLED